MRYTAISFIAAWATLICMLNTTAIMEAQISIFILCMQLELPDSTGEWCEEGESKDHHDKYNKRFLSFRTLHSRWLYGF